MQELRLEQMRLKRGRGRADLFQTNQTKPYF